MHTPSFVDTLVNIMNTPFFVGILVGASAAVSSSLLMGRQAFMQQGVRAVATSLIPGKTRQEKAKDADGSVSLKSYYQLMVNDKGETSIMKRNFINTQEVGYSNTPQIIKKLDPKFAKPEDVVFTALEGENPWHFCPAPQLVVCLGGGWYIKTNDGQITEFRPGDVLYQDNVEQHPSAMKNQNVTDHAGQHFSGSLDGKPCDQMIVQLYLVEGLQPTSPKELPPL